MSEIEASEQRKEVTEPCRDRAEFGRLVCGLERGHVQSEADWHQGKVSVTTSEQGTFHSIKHETTEIARWAPHSFEIPRKPKTDHENTTEETPNA